MEHLIISLLSELTEEELQEVLKILTCDSAKKTE